MKSEVENLCSEYENVLSGYAVLLMYRFINLSVKADANTLLQAVIQIRGEEKKIEEVADVGMRSEERMEIYPHDESFLMPIGHAIMEVHPEFKQNVEIFQLEEDKVFKYLSLTMPDVDKNRHDLLLQGVDAFFDEAKGQTEFAKGKYTIRLERALLNSPEEDIKEAKDKFDAIYDNHVNRIQQTVEDKQKEIEDAYALYQQKQAEQEKSQLEQAAAQGADVVNQIQMPGQS